MPHMRREWDPVYVPDQLPARHHVAAYYEQPTAVDVRCQLWLDPFLLSLRATPRAHLEIVVGKVFDTMAT